MPAVDQLLISQSDLVRTDCPISTDGVGGVDFRRERSLILGLVFEVFFLLFLLLLLLIFFLLQV